MLWLTWRQFRIPLLVGVVIMAATSVALIIIGNRMYHDYLLLQNQNCFATTDSCDRLFEEYYGTLPGAFRNASLILLGMPVLAGVFIGVPLVATEYEQRTYQMIWTQGQPRGKWLARHMIFLFSVVLAVTGTLAALVMWCTNVLSLSDNFTIPDLGRFSTWVFDLSGMVPVAYAAFALALGLACGAIIRRTLPAMAVTIFVFVAARYAVASLWRPYFLPPITIVSQYGSTPPIYPGLFDWRLGQGDLQNGIFYPGGIHPPADCLAQLTNFGDSSFDDCMQGHGIANYVTYQPFTRFWTFQAIETTIFGLAAAGLVWLTFALVMRRP